MDKRFLIALGLTFLVVVLPLRLFPPARSSSPGVKSTRTDSTRIADSLHSDSTQHTSLPSVAFAAPLPATISEATGRVPADTITVSTPKAVYRFTTAGAEPLGVMLTEYRALGKSGSGNLELTRPRTPLLQFRIAAPADTVSLHNLRFAVDSSGLTASPKILAFHATAGSRAIDITYTFVADSYLVHVAGTLEDPAKSPALLLISLPKGLRSAEADTVDDQGHLAFVYKPTHDDAQSIAFTKLAKLDSTQQQVETGPFTWVASKNKYFLIGLLTGAHQTPFATLLFPGAPAQPRTAVMATAVAMQPISSDGRFGFDLYSGPQEFRRLLAIGRDFQDVNPYGGLLRGVVQPFAFIVMRVLLWVHDAVHLSYGWVLVIFGVAVRLILWPLNQSAMRTSLRMQRLQPELTAIQKKYKANPEKQQAEVLKLYKEHGMSPFSPLSGCLPMLLPMPVLFALFFVFRETIEFRGVPFLWLSDISQKDPYYILPILMGISMFFLSWIGMRNSPPNQQAKMMAYTFPIVMIVAFLKLALGSTCIMPSRILRRSHSSGSLLERERDRLLFQRSKGTDVGRCEFSCL